MTSSLDDTAFAPWKKADAVPLIRFEGVTKRYGDFTAIDNIDLNIYEREFFALLGPSGCGKTTLMRMLAGFEDASEGAITIAGQNMKGVPPNRRAVNMMFQSYALFPHLTVYDNIAFGLKRSDMPKSEIAGRVEEMLRLVQLGKFARRKPHQISGGQRQRVALARALAKGPKLLLLDEPLGALDKKLRQQTQFELMDIQEKTGTTFVIVTHDQEEAMTVASRIAVMDHGRLVQVDTPDRIYEAPNSVYVADFVGDIDIIRGHVAAVDGDIAEIVWAEGKPPLRGTAAPGLSAGGPGALAIRPEKITISKDDPGAVHNKVRGKVEDIAYLGSMSTYVVLLPDGVRLKCQMANVRRISRRGIAWEDDVWLSWTDTAGIVLPE
ncbi:putrescine transport system ATP-binding protein [Rhodovulum imhoffii]|uniref:Spermidine/putrescine import ATP-binding protein PotA n=1 Tax=Rhodovulum imhoffii TaxID=365340 RepID=A0A2T5BU11_9RHOB|nr:ABC transporter ATP-binding protein [Rhodovulum imhoffii]MBK5932757.1 polyamine ABC transporter ATP-binding protein [Rhodovulum imhoffii]PTN02964.1 putrescine transport system ATP-binding protein [Rhodovulum imhoffii]